MMRMQSSLFVATALLLLPLHGLRAAPASPDAVRSLPAADVFFTDPALRETRAVIVLRDGKPIYERYAPGYGPGNRFISWSMAKSLTATLVGALVADGRLELDSPAPVPAWAGAGDPRGAITLRQLLHMSSGLQHVEADPAERADTNRALFADKSADIVGHAVSAPLASKPGATYQYSTLTTHILADIVVRTIAPAAKTPVARRAAMQRFLVDRLSGPAAMPSLVCEYDPQGTMLGGSFCHASARDWANFGQLYLDNGVVAGRQVVSPDWVRLVRTPTPTNPGYGGHFWLNRPGQTGKTPALFPDQGPADAYAATGHLGQYVIIVPSRRLVVVRLGKTQDDLLGPIKPALGRLVNSFAAVAP